MKKYKYIIILLIIIGLVISIWIGSTNKSKRQENGKFKIVTSFYPIYIMTTNITQGANNIEVINMADINAGCIHNYTLNTADMKKLEKADVLIQNGLGLENFIDNILSTNKDLQIIDSSSNIINLIKEDDEVNPHIWTSISNYIEQVKNISNALIEKNPENADIYKENTQSYVKKLEDLRLKYNTELQELNGKSAVILNEAFEYLTRDIKLNTIAIHTEHEESTFSAEMIKNIIDNMKLNNIKIIIIDINDDIKNAQTIANETGAVIYKLNSGLTGSLMKDSYINTISGNLDILKNAIY